MKNVTKKLDNFHSFEAIYKSIPELELIEGIYENYRKAMNKRRAGSELALENFYVYVTSTKTVFYKYKNSYVFGVVENGYFIPTHFAPAGLKEGIDLIKELKNFKNIVFVVTEDLKDMLVRLGFKCAPFTVLKSFRGQDVKKFVVVSDYFYTIINMLKSQLKDVTEKAKVFIKNNIDKAVTYFKRDRRRSVVNSYAICDYARVGRPTRK